MASPAGTRHPPNVGFGAKERDTMSDSKDNEGVHMVPHPDDLIIEVGLLVQDALGQALQGYKMVKAACVVAAISDRMSHDEADERMRIVSDLAYASVALLDAMLVAVPTVEGDVSRNVRAVTGADGKTDTVVGPNSLLRTPGDLRKLPEGCVIRFQHGDSWITGERSPVGDEWSTIYGTLESDEINLPGVLLAGPIRDEVEKAFLS